MAEGENWHLYARVTGWHDKAFFWEYYAEAPEFDACGEPSVPARATVWLEDDEKREPTGFLLKNNEIRLVFGKRRSAPVDWTKPRTLTRLFAEEVRVDAFTSSISTH